MCFHPFPRSPSGSWFGRVGTMSWTVAPPEEAGGQVRRVYLGPVAPYWDVRCRCRYLGVRINRRDDPTPTNRPRNPGPLRMPDFGSTWTPDVANVSASAQLRAHRVYVPAAARAGKAEGSAAILGLSNWTTLRRWSGALPDRLVRLKSPGPIEDVPRKVVPRSSVDRQH